MKRFFSATAATALALSLVAAPWASAQQTPQNHGDQKPQAPQMALSAQRPDSGQHAQLEQKPGEPHTDVQQRGNLPQHTVVQQRDNGQQHVDMQQRPPVQQHAEMQPSGHWQHGQHYTGDRRGVSDWGRYHANPPPRGYEWVQDGNELVLISITSGIIASVLANAVYQ